MKKHITLLGLLLGMSLNLFSQSNDSLIDQYSDILHNMKMTSNMEYSLYKAEISNKDNYVSNIMNIYTATTIKDSIQYLKSGQFQYIGVDPLPNDSYKEYANSLLLMIKSLLTIHKELNCTYSEYLLFEADQKIDRLSELVIFRYNFIMLCNEKIN